MSDRLLKKGSPFMLGLFGVLTLFFGTISVTQPERRYFALVFVVLGLVMTWRHYQAYAARKRSQG